MSSPRPLALIVIRGADTGARLVLGTGTRTIGRGRDCDLVLADPCVSRRHLHVEQVGDFVRLETLPGTANVVVDSNETNRVDLKKTQQVVIGDTVLHVTDALVNERAPSKQATTIQALLTGEGADIRGLAALFALVEALDTAHDRASIQTQLSEWARRYVDAARAEVIELDDEDPPGRTNSLERELSSEGDDASTRIDVPCTPPIVLRFGFDRPPERIGNSVRRGLIVASRLCASRFTQVDAMVGVQRDRESLRTIAVGSARDFLGNSPDAQKLAKLIPRLSSSDAAVLIHGETGAGKSFAARLIHESSPRREAPFFVVNCAAIPETLIESELFGHERGAFTGAVTARPGAFESAGRGTVLLDEIGELSLHCQAKLLHIIEEKQFKRVGSTRVIKLEARVVAATNRDLNKMVEAGQFRSDLYFRLAVVAVRVPSLRERKEDIVLLAEKILNDLRSSAGRRMEGFSKDALDAIRGYSWPGNVRELRNAIEHAIVLGDTSTIEVSDLPMLGLTARPVLDDDALTIRLPTSLETLENKAISAALDAARGNRTRAAAILGISRATLHNKLRDLGLDAAKN